jgi:thioredoxin family protein
MKLILFTILFLTTVISLSATPEKVKIHGIVKGLGNNEIVLLNSTQKEIAKVNAQNDKFEITANLETGDGSYYFLYVPSVGPLGPSMSIPTLFLFVDSPDIEISAVIKDKQVSKNYIKGSPMMAEYENIFRNLPVREELEKASVAYNKAFDQYNRVSQTQENLDVLKTAGDKLDSLQKSESQQLLTLIPQMRKSKALALIIYQYNDYRSAPELEELLKQFDPSIRNCYGLIQMQEKINLEKGCEIGQPSPDFELKDLNGQLTKLSSLRGKYTLIDFWASWCGPCRKEIPNLKKVYAEYKDKGLQLIGVSIDNSEAAWQKAVKEEQLDYLQLNDPKNITGKLYNFNGIPFIILISPEGIILEKGLRGTEVGEKVTKYLN